MRDDADRRAFFDQIAEAYGETHGAPDALLAERLGTLLPALALAPDHRVLEVGCGEGKHLAAVAGRVAQATGVDFSPRMIARARRQWAGEPRLRFEVDDGRTLHTLPSESFDRAFVIGALEHMVDPAAVFGAVARVLRPGGRLVCMTPDARAPAPRLTRRLGLPLRHLSSDRFLDRKELCLLAEAVGFERVALGAWRFVPAGDLPWWLGPPLRWASHLPLGALRGGLLLVLQRA